MFTRTRRYQANTYKALINKLELPISAYDLYKAYSPATGVLVWYASIK